MPLFGSKNLLSSLELTVTLFLCALHQYLGLLLKYGICGLPQKSRLDLRKASIWNTENIEKVVK
jgi:hypothetical protein